MGQPVRVDLASLRTLGGQILAVGEDLRRNAAAVDGRLATPDGPGVAGWATSGALTGAARGWHDYLSGLVGRVDRAGQALIDAANNYQAADERAARRHGDAARYQ